MDPAENLRQQREVAARIAAGGHFDDEVAALGERLADLVLRLDEWRVRGGFDPYTATSAADADAPR